MPSSVQLKLKPGATQVRLNRKTPDVRFEEIFRDKISKQKKILERLEENLNVKKMIENNFCHVIPSGDPSFSMAIENGNGL